MKKHAWKIAEQNEIRIIEICCDFCCEINLLTSVNPTTSAKYFILNIAMVPLLTHLPLNAPFLYPLFLGGRASVHWTNALAESLTKSVFGKSE